MNDGQDIPVIANKLLKKIPSSESWLRQKEAIIQIPNCDFQLRNFEVILKIKHVLLNHLLQLHVIGTLDLSQVVTAHKSQNIKWQVFGSVPKRKVVSILVLSYKLLHHFAFAVLLLILYYIEELCEFTVYLLFFLHTVF